MLYENYLNIEKIEEIDIPPFKYLLVYRSNKFIGIIDESRIINEKGFKQYEQYINDLNSLSYEIDSIDYFINQAYYEKIDCINLRYPKSVKFVCNVCKAKEIIYSPEIIEGESFCVHKFEKEIAKNTQKYFFNLSLF